MPDLDAIESKTKHAKAMGIKPLVPVSKAINREFGHRRLLHSLRGWLIWTALIVPLDAGIGWLPVAALLLGYASHLAGDACTQTGIPLFYPDRRPFHLLPVRLRVVTDSDYEELVFAAFAVLTVAYLLGSMQSQF